MEDSELQGSPSGTTAARPGQRGNRVKGPTEDAWLKVIIDPESTRSLLHSRRRIALNPDVLQARILRCYCGSEVNVDHSWHVMAVDGTLVCGACARCNCCARENNTSCRRLVCIDGMVLCYRCVKRFGQPFRYKAPIRVVALPGKNSLETFSKGTGSDDAQQNHSNSEYYDYNVPRTDRCSFVPKTDMRRPIRATTYEPPPFERLAKLENPLIVPPLYLAENTGQDPMNCPACNNVAMGPRSYVVPSMARVYHRHCFRCCNCKESLSHGMKIAGVWFEYCSCRVPMVWCCKTACRNARFAHHQQAKCRLGCIRPGGRVQMDLSVEKPPEKVRRRKRAPTRSSIRRPSQVSQPDSPGMNTMSSEV